MRELKAASLLGTTLMLGLLMAVLLVAALSCTTTPPDRQAASETPAASQQEGVAAVNRIAYTDAVGNLYTIKPDGTDSRTVAADRLASSAGHVQAQGIGTTAFYAWPTWSPDGTKLGISRVDFGGLNPIVSVHAVDIASDISTRLYENEPGANLVITSDAPHYMYWSPDSSLLTFIASTPRALTLFSASPEGDGPAVQIATQGPIYFSWSRDGGSLLMHRMRGDLLVSRLASLQQQDQLTSAALGFRAPALSPDASRATYVAANGTGLALFLADVQGRQPPVAIGEVGSNVAFLWSPVEDEIAVADTQSSTDPSYDRLRILNADGTGERVLLRESFMAFFWSPDGKQILYVTFDQGDNTLTWNIVSTAGGETRELLDFIPSPELFTLLNFFDQYAYSHSLWSPDGSQFVFAGILRRDLAQGNGASPLTLKVYVVDIAAATAKEIASGRLAFWSWN